MNIPLSRPLVGDDEGKAVAEVLASGMLASGEQVARFEDAFAEMCGTEHAVAVGSGTAALHLGLLAAGVGPGHEVIVPSFTFAATANVVRLCGADPVFVDVDPATFCITGRHVEAAVTDRTVGVMPVHLYGHPAPLDEITAVAEAAGIDVYEDAAQAHGASWLGRPVGQWGAFAAFSFYPTKNMTTGEGGMITTNDAGIARRARLLRNQGMSERYVHEVVGMNERMTEIEAALGLAQLARLAEWNERRRQNAAFYRDNLDPRLGLPADPEQGIHVYHQFTIRPPDRVAMTSALEEASIGYGIYYPTPTHLQAPFATTGLHLPETERLSRQVVSIPIRPDLSPAELDAVASTLNTVVAS